MKDVSAPRPGVWPLVVTNMIAAALAVAPGLPLAVLTVPTALAAAVVVGLPALWLALVIGLRGELPTTTFGAGVGLATPYIAMIAMNVVDGTFNRPLGGVDTWFLLLCGVIGGVSAGLYWAFNLAPPGLRFWRAIRLPLLLLVSCWLVEVGNLVLITRSRR